MEITEVRVKVVGDHRERLRGFCTVTVDEAFAIRDMKIIEINSKLFVAMPSRKLCCRRPRCRTKNPLRANFCNECGLRLPAQPLPRTQDGRLRLHADVVYPINARVRDALHEKVFAAYREESERAGQPGYCPPLGFEDDDDLGQPMQWGSGGSDSSPEIRPNAG